MVSYGVVSLYTKVPIQQALEIMKTEIRQRCRINKAHATVCNRSYGAVLTVSEIYSIHFQRKAVCADRRTPHGFTIIPGGS